jgi:hypothetical protein
MVQVSRPPRFSRVISSLVRMESPDLSVPGINRKAICGSLEPRAGSWERDQGGEMAVKGAARGHENHLARS